MHVGINRLPRRVALVCLLAPASPLARTASAQLATPFVSKQYGYSIALPGVTGRAGSISWQPDSTLSGAPARVVTWLCSDGYRVFAITALHDHRGYVMRVASPTALSRASDLRAFDVARRSFRFPTR